MKVRAYRPNRVIGLMSLNLVSGFRYAGITCCVITRKKPSQPVEGSYDRFNDLFNNLPTLVGEYCIRHGGPWPGATGMSRRSSEERGKLLDIAVEEGILPSMGDGIRRTFDVPHAGGT